ncbi:hypothetical protein CEXT_485411 [Caerostris extrusa]|uniref:Uncharacterized protein n=1 Tax=Caerostris extrusa TaxID=172846 RepID=A0AAV4Y2C5_CAEEX|nr:hypothetical protein CEXT_485411 [Caerostris extrusa]
MHNLCRFLATNGFQHPMCFSIHKGPRIGFWTLILGFSHVASCCALSHDVSFCCCSELKGVFGVESEADGLWDFAGSFSMTKRQMAHNDLWVGFFQSI